MTTFTNSTITPGTNTLPAHLMYLSLGAGLFSSWLFAVFAMIIAYIVVSDWKGTALDSHASWVLRTFWWGLLWTLVGWLLIFPFVIGVLGPSWIVWGIAWVWAAYRIIRGWVRLAGGRAAP
jgi:uncharacterized membrane protein